MAIYLAPFGRWTLRDKTAQRRSARRWPENNLLPNDIAEGLGKAIFRGISRLVFDILIEIFFFYTGEIVLYIVTLGHKKPR